MVSRSGADQMMRFQNKYICISFLSFFYKHVFHEKHEYFRDAIFFLCDAMRFSSKSLRRVATDFF